MPGHYERCDCWHRAHLATEIHRRGVARRARSSLGGEIQAGRARPLRLTFYRVHAAPVSSLGGEIQAGHARPLRTL
ncbi:hypothetical protein ACQKDS_06790 [Serratia sp. NPDC078593]|uniref:hypothetical protein n=1 Tax=unclassified Serratia (in: enterobacteria) TaxID=2647522 RepID=UPI0037D4A8D0